VGEVERVIETPGLEARRREASLLFFPWCFM